MGYIRTPIHKISSKYDLYISPITGTATPNPGTGPLAAETNFAYFPVVKNKVTHHGGVAIQFSISSQDSWPRSVLDRFGTRVVIIEGF